MTYDSLDKIPYKLFFKIAETSDFSLLSDTEKDPDILKNIWELLYEEHLNRKASQQEKKTFRISKEIDSLEIKYKVTLLACEALKFAFDNDLVELLTKQYGFTLRTTDEVVYYQDIEKIERESKSFKVKIGVLSKLLPKEDQGQEFNIDDVMASYCSILGFQIGDFNTITYTAFFGYEKQVHAKIDSIKKQEIKNKK